MASEAKNEIKNTLPLIAWQPEFNLGIHIVDEHHRGILAAVNTLNYEIERQQGEDALAPIFKIMQEYTHTHFKIEEEFFEKFDFPDTTSHRALHNELVDTLLKAGEKSLLNHDPSQLMDFLQKWWIDHIRNKDRKFRDHLLGE